MCDDCERSVDAVVADKPRCACDRCMVGGTVIAVERPPGSVETGLGPWCVACHHFILTGGARDD